MSYNRYKKYTKDGKIGTILCLTLPAKSSDYFEIYKRGTTRLDKVSFKYYDDPNYDWLIMLANPELGSMEFEIPDGSVLRIPYPLETSIRQYEEQITKQERLYGI